MATFVSLATCCTLVPGPGLVCKRCLSALSQNLVTPVPAHRAPRLVHRYAAQTRRHARCTSVPRPDPPERIALPGPKPAVSVRHVVFANLRRLLTPSPGQGLREPHHNVL